MALRADTAGVSPAETVFFYRTIFTPVTQYRHGMTLGRVNAMSFCPPASSDFAYFFGRVP